MRLERQLCRRNRNCSGIRGRRKKIENRRGIRIRRNGLSPGSSAIRMRMERGSTRAGTILNKTMNRSKKLMMRSGFRTPWPIWRMMMSMSPIMMKVSNSIGIHRRSILIKKWKASCLMMKLMLYPNHKLTWREEEECLREANLKSKKNLRNLSMKEIKLEAR